MNIKILLIRVAYAAPTISNLGKPKSPKIRIAFKIIFMTFENIEMYMAGFVKPRPSINCLNV